LKKNLRNFFQKNIFFERNLQKKLSFKKKFQKNFPEKIVQKLFLPTLVEVGRE